MRVLEGKSVFSGIAIGKISILQKADTSVKRTKVENPEAEITRVQEAKEKAVEQLQKLYDKALREVGESGAAIFEVHQMMLDDEDYLDSIDNIIRTENVNAEYAVATTGDNFADMFAQMDDDYMKARAADVKDISDRLVRVLSGHDEGDMDAAEPSIIVAEDLAPSETVQMDKSKVLAFVTRKGSSNSHTAILARTMNIPALINIEYDDSMDGKMAVVDGKTQVTVEYDDGKPVKVTAVVVSSQHSADVELETLRQDIIDKVIKTTVPAELMDEDTVFYVNPTGRFVVGGPHGDSGLTGRKIIVDTYGGYARHGGGAFSGKDPTKVDRSAAYAARWVAKNLVAAGLADKCEVELAYAIGVAKPVSVMVDTQGTGKVSDDVICDVINKVFDLRPSAIIERLNLRRPIYRQVAAYGHMGREELNVPWEQLDMVDKIKACL